MKRKGLTQAMSVMLAVSMVATTGAPAMAAEIPVAEETQAVDEAVVEEAVEAEATPEAAPEISDEKESRALTRELSEGALDAWTQDEATVVGSAGANELFGTNFRHFVAATTNGNSHSDSSSYPAMFVNPNTFDFSQEGYFEFTLWTAQAPSSVRFGVMLGYNGPGNGLFFGYDADGWFWQKYENSGGDWYRGTRVAGPAATEYTDVRITWNESKQAALQIKGSDEAEYTTIFEAEDFSDIYDSFSSQIAVKCGAFNGAATNVYMRDIHYTGQKEVKDYTIQGSVTDQTGAALEGATVTVGGQSGKTDAEGNITLNAHIIAGTYTATIQKYGYVTKEVTVVVTEDETVTYTFEAALDQKPELETKTISSTVMDVEVGSYFPFAVQYNMKGDLAGKTFYGQADGLDTIQINGVNITVGEEDVETTFTADKAVYRMSLINEEENIDCVLTAELKVEDNVLSFDVTDVQNNLTETDANGYEVYPVQTINIPNHSLVSVRSNQNNANMKAAKVSSNTLISGDSFVNVTNDMTFNTGDYMYAFVSNDELSAGLWSNSEHQGTHVAAYVTAGGASNTRVIATTSDLGGVNSLGLASAEWYYDRKVTPTVNGSARTYVVEHDIMPSAKVAITGDENADEAIDWQDGAIAYRGIMNNPYKSEEVPNLVNQRIAMDFGSQAANPFLTILDGVKRVYLNTDGLGQSVLLKGYGSEGHDSGHPDYGDIGTRIGGAEDMNTLMEEGADMGAKFGVHINASEMYPEAKAFSDELSRGNYGWNWLDQGIGINGMYDLASGERLTRLQDLKDQVGDNLDFIYLDVWGNQTSGIEDAWESRNIARQINSMGWRFTTEWGATQEYDSTMQHWAADLNYGGNAAKGQNSEVMRFLRNHQKDSWIADYSKYGGAAQAPLLGGLEMTDFEGWSGRTNYNNYITVMFRHNLMTKFLQHYKVMKWVDGDAVEIGTSTWVPEMEITLQDDEKETTIVATRDSNDYSNLDAFRGRTVTYNGTVISKGARTSGDGTEGSSGYVGDESYLMPWLWDTNGDELSADDQKLYHWNTQGGTTTWELIDEWKNLDNVIVYKLTDEGRTEKTVVDVVEGMVTLEAEAETPYVVHKGEKAELTVDWQTSPYIYDMGFNDADLTTKRTVIGNVSIADNASANPMLKMEGGSSYTTQLTNLTPGENYALYIGVDNRSDAKASMTVTDGTTLLAGNYTERSYIQNIVSSDQHHTGSGATVEDGSSTSYFQNMYVFFTAPASGTATLTLSREKGQGATYFDDVRVVKTEMDAVKATDKEGNITELFNDFENNAQGIWPFVISGPGQGSGAVTDNRIHLSEAHSPYTDAGYKDKRVDDVLEGDWSVKINGLTQNQSMIYQTIPQNFRFEPGETYYVEFDYQLGSEGTYEVRVGDGIDTNVEANTMPAAIGETKHYGFSFTASDSGQSWFGIYSTATAPDMHGFTTTGSTNFSGYGDFILDNLAITKAGMTISKTSYETTSAKEKLPLSVTLSGAEEDTKVIWTSSDESVAHVTQEGLVSFVGFGTAMITATATINGKEQSLGCTVTLVEDYQKNATYKDVWTNTEETRGEDGRAKNVTDGNSGSIWHSQYGSFLFVVSESNPAILTLQIEENLSEFAVKQLVQRSGANGLVQKYELIVGNTFDSATNTITDGKSTGAITAQNDGSGESETLVLPADGHYLQIRVLEGANQFASIADVLLYTPLTYNTPEEQAYLEANKVDVLIEKKAAETDPEKVTELNEEIVTVLTALEEKQTALVNEAELRYEELVASETATEEEKAAAAAVVAERTAALKATSDYLGIYRNIEAVEDLLNRVDDADRATLESIQASLENYKAAQEELTIIKSNLITANGNIADLKAKLEVANNTLSTKRQELADATATLTELQAELEEANGENAELQAEYDLAAAAVDRLEGEVKTLEESAAQLKLEKEAAEKALDEQKNDYEARLSEIQKQLAEEKAKTDQLIKDLEAAKAEAEASKKAEEAAKAEAEASKKAEEVAKAEAEASKKAEEAAKKLAEELSKQLEAAQKETAQLQKDLEETKGSTSTDTLKKGDIVVVNGVTYKVLSTVSKTAAAIAVNSSAASIKVANTVTVKNVSCRVTQIAKGAFKNTNAKSAVIGTNVTKIGKNAFYNAKSLKKVTIKSKKLKSVGAKAFAKISVKTTIKVPKAKKKAYQKLLKNKVSARTVIK